MEDNLNFMGIGTSSRIQLLKCSSEVFLRAQEKLSDKYGIHATNSGSCLGGITQY